MTRAPRALCVAAAALGLHGCHLELLRENPLGCRSDERAMVRDTLYFGASIPGGGAVDASAWQQFAADTLTAAFPQGYSVVDAHGVWRDAGGRSTQEDSRIVSIVHADTASIAQAVRQVAATYRERFHQESVLRERAAVCAQF